MGGERERCMEGIDRKTCTTVWFHTAISCPRPKDVQVACVMFTATNQVVQRWIVRLGSPPSFARTWPGPHVTRSCPGNPLFCLAP